jgi:uncharacterized protein
MSDHTARPVVTCRIAPQTGIAVELDAGDVLRVIDPEGEQVSDVTAFAASDSREWLSSGRTIDYANSIYVTTGDVLYSNRSRPMFTIVADTVGRHDFLLTPCSPETFELLYEGDTAGHPSCFGNLTGCLARYGIAPDAIPTTFNIFMNVEIAANGELTIGPPRSRAGDRIELRAEMKLIVGITACSAEKSNNGTPKPIDLEIVRCAER